MQWSVVDYRELSRDLNEHACSIWLVEGNKEDKTVSNRTKTEPKITGVQSHGNSIAHSNFQIGLS